MNLSIKTVSKEEFYYYMERDEFLMELLDPPHAVGQFMGQRIICEELDLGFLLGKLHRAWTDLEEFCEWKPHIFWRFLKWVFSPIIKTFRVLGRVR